VKLAKKKTKLAKYLVTKKQQFNQKSSFKVPSNLLCASTSSKQMSTTNFGRNNLSNSPTYFRRSSSFSTGQRRQKNSQSAIFRQ